MDRDQTPRPHSCARCILRFLGKLIALLLLLASIAWLARGPILTKLTDWWIIDETVTPADAVIVLGGGLNTRTFAAAELFRTKQVPLVLIPKTKPSPIEVLGIVKSHTELCREVVAAENVPIASIQLIGIDVSSTWEEAAALKKWATENKAAHILIPTEFPYTRRLRWIMDRTFEGTGTRVTVTAINPMEFTRADWWTREEGLISVQNELIKYLLYRVKY